MTDGVGEACRRLYLKEGMWASSFASHHGVGKLVSSRTSRANADNVNSFARRSGCPTSVRVFPFSDIVICHDFLHPAPCTDGSQASSRNPARRMMRRHLSPRTARLTPTTRPSLATTNSVLHRSEASLAHHALLRGAFRVST
jgi:hypothetical protein